MSTPPIARRATLGRIVDDLGETLLEVLAGKLQREQLVSNVVIHDPLDPTIPGPGSLLLGVGLADAGEIAALLAHPDVVGVIIKAPVGVDAAVADATASCDAVLLGLTRGASWAQVAALLRALLSAGEESERLIGMPAGDLFGVANAVAALIDAPVTIEDRNTRVLAFSSNQDQADSSRVATILGRQVPEEYRRSMEEQGVFRELYASDDPIFVTGIGTELDRMAVRVRAGDEILGSIWAAVTKELSPERSAALAEASKLVALHLLLDRVGADVERRLESEQLAAVLEGGPDAADAATRLGLRAGGMCVLALSHTDDEPSSPQAEAEFQRVVAAFRMHLTAVHPRSAVAPVGRVLYSVLPADGSPAEVADRAERIATAFISRIAAGNPVVIGIGRPVEDCAGLPRSRADADRALRVLREGPRRARVAHSIDVHVEALLIELRDMVELEGREPTGPITRLADYDRKHGSGLLATLRAWLDAFGDVGVAAAAVHVHPNTYRYRLRRVAEVGGLDLTDPETRFAMMLQMRVHPGQLSAGS